MIQPIIAGSFKSTDAQSLDGAVVRGFAWTAGIKWTGQLISWSLSLIVARLLTPGDYGLVGMATIYLGLVTLLSEFGISTAAITLRELKKEQLAQLHTVTVLLGMVALAISAILAHPLGIFFKEPRLPRIVEITSLAFPFLAYRTVPYAVLQKEMRFKLVAIADGIQVLAQAVTTVVMAILGFQLWALVIGGLVGATASAALTFVWCPQVFAYPDWKALRDTFRFSWRVCIANLSWYAYDNTDFLIVGRLLGSAALGGYTIAWTLAHLPMEKFTNLVNRLTPALFAAVQTDTASLRRYLRILTEGIALVTFPASLGIALTAPEFIRLALGSKWDGAIVPLQLLGVYSSLRCVRVLLNPLLTAIGETRVVMNNTLISLVILPVSFLIGSRWGTGGVASCWVIVYPILSIPLYKATFRNIRMQGIEYLKAISPALNGCLALAGAVELVKALMIHSPLYLRFACEVGMGVLAYAFTLVVVHYQRLRAIQTAFRLLLGHPGFVSTPRKMVGTVVLASESSMRKDPIPVASSEL